MAFWFFRDRTTAARVEAAERVKARGERVAPPDPLAMRSAEQPHDRAALAHTLRWAETLPDGIRPWVLMERYPRVANRLALCWSDKVLTRRLFEDLLTDRRGGRQGFPPPVRAELLRLRLEHAQPDREPSHVAPPVEGLRTSVSMGVPWSPSRELPR